MKKEKAAELLANGTHAIYEDNGNIELLREILTLAFPNDKDNSSYSFKAREMYYFIAKNKYEWIDFGFTTLETINLSSIESNRERPDRYKDGIDTLDRMESNCSLEERLAFVKGNIDKYNWRKKDQDIEDFKKIIEYAKWAIKQLEK